MLVAIIKTGTLAVGEGQAQQHLIPNMVELNISLAELFMISSFVELSETVTHQFLLSGMVEM
jgi:hypothetical protein